MADLATRKKIMTQSLGDMTRQLVQQISDAPDGAALDEIGARLEDLSVLTKPRPAAPWVHTD
jgi:hypothetical protein